MPDLLRRVRAAVFVAVVVLKSGLKIAGTSIGFLRSADEGQGHEIEKKGAISKLQSGLQYETQAKPLNTRKPGSTFRGPCKP